MTIDNKLMIEMADWVLETTDGGGIITKDMVACKMGELMVKYEAELKWA